MSDGEGPIRLVPRGGRFEGLVCCRTDVRIDGALCGELECEGRVVIGEASSVEARLRVGEAVVLGNVAGEVLAARRIEIGERAEVRATLRAPRVTLADGCCFEGRLEMGSQPAGNAVSGGESP